VLGWLETGTKALQAAGSLAGSGDAAPSSAKFGASSFGFDNSNWTVATGNAKAGAQLHPAVLAGAAILVVLVVWHLTKNS
jgi:hypothetical protein